MSRKIKMYRPFLAELSLNKGGHEAHYARLAGTMLESEKAKKLPHTAFRVLVYMIYFSCGNIEFTMSRSHYKDWISAGGFDSAVKRLVKEGFIDVKEKNKNLRKPNVYAFSFRWHTQ